MREAELEQELCPLDEGRRGEGAEEAGKDPRPAFVPPAFRDDALARAEAGMVCLPGGRTSPL